MGRAFHPRVHPAGRVCAICGRGDGPDISGAAPALAALGYEWNRKATLGYAHNRCLLRERRKMKRS